MPPLRRLRPRGVHEAPGPTRTHQDFEHMYALHPPGEERPASRGERVTPLCDRLAEKGCVYGEGPGAPEEGDGVGGPRVCELPVDDVAREGADLMDSRLPPDNRTTTLIRLETSPMEARPRLSAEAFARCAGEEEKGLREGYHARAKSAGGRYGNEALPPFEELEQRLKERQGGREMTTLMVTVDMRFANAIDDDRTRRHDSDSGGSFMPRAGRHAVQHGFGRTGRFIVAENDANVSKASMTSSSGTAGIRIKGSLHRPRRAYDGN